MENQVQVINANPSLDALRQAVAEAVKRAYGAERDYAVALNTQFGSFDWFTVEAADVSEAAKPVHAEKGELYKVLKAAKHSNPSTVWARIRKYGREEKYPKAETGEGGEGSGEGEGGDSQAGNTRSPMLRNVEELTALYKFNARQESLPKQVHAAQTFIVSALRELGIDVSLIK